jgi:hypothetical protein
MLFKSFALKSLLIATSILGIASTASAENLTTVDTGEGIVFQIDLDERRFVKSVTGLKHVEFWLSIEGDEKKHRAMASCNPYDLQVEDYNIEWRSDNEGYPEGTVAGNIARVACQE